MALIYKKCITERVLIKALLPIINPYYKINKNI